MFAVALWQLSPSWSDLTAQLTTFDKPATESWMTYAYYSVALFGAAMTPYEVFFFSSGGVEEGWRAKDLSTMRANVFIGFPLGGVLSLAIAGCAATVFGPLEVDVASLSQVGLPVGVALGKVGIAIVLVGFVAATFGAACETGLSVGYSLGQYFGWQWGKYLRPGQATRFHAVLTILTLLAVLVLLTGVDPILVTELSVIGSYGVSGRHCRPVGQTHPDRPRVAHDDRIHACVAADRAAPNADPGCQRVGEGLGAALWHRKSDLLSQHRKEPAEDPTTSAIGVDIGVHGVPGQEKSCPFTPEPLGSKAPHRQDSQPGQIQRARRTDPAQGGDQGPHGRERPEETVEDGPPDAFPTSIHRLPRVTITGREPVHIGCGRGERAADRDTPVVGQDVGEHGGGMLPGQAIAIEIQSGNDRRGDRQGVERTEEVGDETGTCDLTTSDRAANRVVRLQDHDIPADIDQRVRGDQPVGTRADDHGVVLICHRPRSSPRAVGLRWVLSSYPNHRHPCGPAEETRRNSVGPA